MLIIEPVYMGSQVSNPTLVSKSIRGGKVSPFEPQETIEIWLINIKAVLDYFMENVCGTCFESCV
jgi:hypothetical protein